MGTPNKPCHECPFHAANAGTMCGIMIDQMEENAHYLKGFPCHKVNNGNDILTCSSPEENANDCVGYKLMMANRKAITIENLGIAAIPHPEVVSSFDALIK